MFVQRVRVGELQENCYILSQDNKVLVIDPGDEANRIIEVIEDREVLGILVTHGHFDHVGAVDDLVKKYNCKVYKYGSVNLGTNNISPFEFEAIHFPGHSEDLVAYYFDEGPFLFSGDFVFRDSIGRMDLEGGDSKKMKESIKKLLDARFDNDLLVIYPGHGGSTVLEDEKEMLEYYYRSL